MVQTRSGNTFAAAFRSSGPPATEEEVNDFIGRYRRDHAAFREAEDERDRQEQEREQEEQTVNWQRGVTFRVPGPTELPLNHGNTSTFQMQSHQTAMVNRMFGGGYDDSNDEDSHNSGGGSNSSTRGGRGFDSHSSAGRGYSGGRIGRGGGRSGGRGRSGRGGRHAGIDLAPAAPGRLSGAPRRTLVNPISYETMVNSIVDEKVDGKYVNEIILVIDWAFHNEKSWLSPWTLETHPSLYTQRAGETYRAFRRRVKSVYSTQLRKAKEEPVFLLENITPQRVMEYIASQGHYKTGGALKIESYGTKRSALRHMFRLHNGKGFPPELSDEISTAWKGFRRVSTKKRQRTTVVDDEDDDDDASAVSLDPVDDNDRDDFKEGKEPMSPDLYRALCKWALELGTVEGIFLCAFVVWTWNLCCRGHNTSRIRLSHISWAPFSDSIGVFFRHTKSDQTGESKRQKRSLFSNVVEPHINIAFVTALYFATCFQQHQTPGRKLFPGSAEAQSKRASDLMAKILKEHETEVLAMGYDSVEDIGLHSIRKGACSWLASLPGGPSAAAICLRAGWTMGRIRDIYFRWMDTGDEFVGRSVCLLNMHSKNFAASPQEFDDTVDAAWIQQEIGRTFPCFANMVGFGRLLPNMLASLVANKNVVLNFGANHVARSILLFRSAISPNITTRVKYAWDQGYAASGVPPHIKVVVDLTTLRERQQSLVKDVTESIMTALKQYFDEQEIGEDLTVGRMNSMLRNCMSEFGSKLDALSTKLDTNVLHGRTSDESSIRVGDGRVSAMQQHGSALPLDWRFPNGSPSQIWLEWNLGDSNRGVPPLRSLDPKEFKFLDDIPLTEAEMRSKRGPKKSNQRRTSRRTYSEMKFLCNFLEARAKRAGLDTNDTSPSNIRRMFHVSADELKQLFKQNQRVQEQGKWSSLVPLLRKHLKNRRASSSGGDRQTKRAARGAQEDTRRQFQRRQQYIQTAEDHLGAVERGAGGNEEPASTPTECSLGVQCNNRHLPGYRNCHRPGCTSKIHHLCAISSNFLDPENELYSYCSSKCMP